MKIQNRKKHLLSLPNYKLYKRWFNSGKKTDINNTDELQSMVGELKELQGVYWDKINQQPSKSTQDIGTQTHTRRAGLHGKSKNH